MPSHIFIVVKRIAFCLFVAVLLFLSGATLSAYLETRYFGYDFGISKRFKRELPLGLTPETVMITREKGFFDFQYGKGTDAAFVSADFPYQRKPQGKWLYMDAYVVFGEQLYANMVDTLYRHHWFTPTLTEENRIEWIESDLPADIHEADLYVPIYGNHKRIAYMGRVNREAYFMALFFAAILLFIAVAFLFFKASRYIRKMRQPDRAGRYDEESGPMKKGTILQTMLFAMKKIASCFFVFVVAVLVLLFGAMHGSCLVLKELGHDFELREKYALAFPYDPKTVIATDAYAVFGEQVYANVVDTLYQHHWFKKEKLEGDKWSAWEASDSPADIHEADLYVPVYGNRERIDDIEHRIYLSYWSKVFYSKALLFIAVAYLLFKGFRYLWKMGKSVRARRNI